MDREILFRGKRVDNGEWVYGYYANCQCPGYKPHITGHYIIEYPGSYHEIYTSTVGQYTGLNDRNGKRIFEGDILNHVSWMGSIEPGVVEMNDGSWVVVEDEDHYEFLCDTNTIDRQNVCEIIGNIHDNPELLRA